MGTIPHLRNSLLRCFYVNWGFSQEPITAPIESYHRMLTDRFASYLGVQPHHLRVWLETEEDPTDFDWFLLSMRMGTHMDDLDSMDAQFAPVMDALRRIPSQTWDTELLKILVAHFPTRAAEIIQTSHQWNIPALVAVKPVWYDAPFSRIMFLWKVFIVDLIVALAAWISVFAAASFEQMTFASHITAFAKVMTFFTCAFMVAVLTGKLMLAVNKIFPWGEGGHHA